jgi:hypothetical protein
MNSVGLTSPLISFLLKEFSLLIDLMPHFEAVLLLALELVSLSLLRIELVLVVTKI